MRTERRDGGRVLIGADGGGNVSTILFVQGAVNHRAVLQGDLGDRRTSRASNAHPTLTKDELMDFATDFIILKSRLTTFPFATAIL